MDDVNNMDESVDAVEQSTGGVSRRDMIKASVIAGGLIWSAPVLLTGKAAAQTTGGCPCPGGGTLVSVKVTQGPTPQKPNGTVNCGVSCLDHLFTQAGQTTNKNIACNACAGLADALVTVESYDRGRPGVPGTAEVLVNPGVTIAGASANANICHTADCNNAFVDPTGRITVAGQQVSVQLQEGDGVLQHVEIAMCLPGGVSPFCP